MVNGFRHSWNGPSRGWKVDTDFTAIANSTGSAIMAELKTKKTGVSVDSFLDKVANAEQRADAYTILALMKDITGAEPRMWGPSIVGFGEYHYVYESGREGDICLTGFSPRKSALVIYFNAGFFEQVGPKLKKLGKCKTSKGCM